MVLAVAAAMAVMVTAGVAPAMANNNNNDRNLDRMDVRLDKNLLNKNNDGFRFDDGFRFNDGLEFNEFNNSCFPFCDNFNNFGFDTHGAVSGSTVNITR